MILMNKVMNKDDGFNDGACSVRRVSLMHLHFNDSTQTVSRLSLNDYDHQAHHDEGDDKMMEYHLMTYRTIIFFFSSYS